MSTTFQHQCFTVQDVLYQQEPVRVHASPVIINTTCTAQQVEYDTTAPAGIIQKLTTSTTRQLRRYYSPVKRQLQQMGTRSNVVESPPRQRP
jgi:hypothetical protein